MITVVGTKIIEMVNSLLWEMGVSDGKGWKGKLNLNLKTHDAEL